MTLNEDEQEDEQDELKDEIEDEALADEVRLFFIPRN